MVPQSSIIGDGDDDAVVFHNPWLEPKGAALIELADAIFAETEAGAQSDGRRKPRKDAQERRRVAVGNVVASAAAFELAASSESGIAISVRREASGRYDRKDIHRDLLPDAVKALARMGLLEVTPGEAHTKRTTFRASEALKRRLTAAGVTGGDIGVKRGGETIVLKATTGQRGKKVWVDYVETPETSRMRVEVDAISAACNMAEIRLDGRLMPPVFMQRVFQIEGADAPHVFNRHGRLWGGWWQNLPKDQRHLITIDGEPIADLDFKACFLNLAYARVGCPLPAGDPYAIEGLDGYRAALKKAFATMLFRDGSRRERMPAEIARELAKGWSLGRLIAAFREKHVAIGGLFGTGVGMEIMHTESEILVATLLDLARQGIPALGMHDGLALPASKKDQGLAAMKSASKRIVGVEIPAIEKPLADRPK